MQLTSMKHRQGFRASYLFPPLIGLASYSSMILISELISDGLLPTFSITAYGQDGPYRDRPGYDMVLSAVGGLMWITGERDGDPCKVGVAITDVLTGVYASGAITAALLWRERSGQGQYL